MTSKKFFLSAWQICPIAEGFGSCFATDRIVVDGKKVGYCYREQADSDHDSGWRFYAGDESQVYVATAANLGIYDVNTIANCDPNVIPLLSSPIGSAFERNDAGAFVQVSFAKLGEA